MTSASSLPIPLPLPLPLLFMGIFIDDGFNIQKYSVSF
jgi:hypothetical protein